MVKELAEMTPFLEHKSIRQFHSCHGNFTLTGASNGASEKHTQNNALFNIYRAPAEVRLYSAHTMHFGRHRLSLRSLTCDTISLSRPFPLCWEAEQQEILYVFRKSRLASRYSARYCR